MHDKIIILDCGGQYAHLIASRIRRQQVLAEIHQPDEISISTLSDPSVKGIILSGGPQSVYETGSIKVDPEIFTLNKPVLGICYGHQLLNQTLGGKVIAGTGKKKEFGRAELTHDGTCPLFKDIDTKSVFWMSHGDEVSALAPGFKVCGTTAVCGNAAAWDPERNIFGVQFHPEVTHSQFGHILLKNFVDICEPTSDWTMEEFLAEKSAELLQKIGDKNVFLFVSGGVDSTVCFAFLSKILGADRVRGLFVDTGMMRQDEVAYVSKSIRSIGADLTVLSEAETFLGNLKNKYEPEAKRKIIGNTFLEVQRKFFAENQLGDEWILAQGTIYPDTIESGGTKNASTIKTHHNRVPEIQKLIDEGKVIEPVADLYKDEVRALGALLGLPKELVWRHPFPGPGLGVRILCSGESIKNETLNIKKYEEMDYQVLPIKSVGVQGDFRTYRHPAVLQTEITDLGTLEKISTEIINHDTEINRCLLCLGKQNQTQSESNLITITTGAVQKSDLSPDRVTRLQRADHIVTQQLQTADHYNTVWQFPVVMTPICFDGNGQESIILRPIDSIDAMSASVGKLPLELLKKMAAEILQDKDISAVFLDTTSKPPGTIEWE
jgi:GMP synthase (glutamine-hydrolysing)